MEGVGANQKIGQNPLALSTSLAIRHMGDPGGVSMVGCERYDLNTDLPQPAIEFIAISGLRHQLGVDGRRDNERALLVDLKKKGF
jgi:hypothetical protein